MADSLHVNDPLTVMPTSQDVFNLKNKPPFKVMISLSIVAIVAVGIVMGLMWQSNSFIAQNQDMRSEASGTSAESVAVVSQSGLATIDQRFGVGGNCDMAKKIGVPWTFNWGGGWNGKFNDSEIKCATTSSGTMSTILTFGHADEWDHAIDTLYDLPALEQTAFAANPEVKADYDKLKALLDQHPVIYNRTKILANYLKVPEVVNQYPSAYIQIANEPDWMPYFKPEDFAKYYTYFYRQIRRFDKGAKISFGGLAWPRYNHSHKWTRSIADWSLWEDQTPLLGGGSAPITALSILDDETHVTRGNEVYVNTAGSSEWPKVTSNFTSGQGNITSFHQYIDPNTIKRQFYVRGGVVWSRNNSGGWSDWTDSLQSQISVGSGAIRTFSEVFDRGKLKQYVVRCASGKWNATNNSCTDNSFKLFSRSKDPNPSVSWIQDWVDVTANIQSFGEGTVQFFSGYSNNSGRVEIIVRGTQALKREGGYMIADKSLINDSYITQLIAANPANRDLYENAAWFLIFYKNLQALNPVAEIDYFNIHPYAWTNHNVGGSGYTSATIADAIADTKNSIQFIDQLRTLNISPSLASKPIIITEFSHAGNMSTGDCNSITNCEQQTAIISKAYIDGVVPWLKQNTLVHRWLWFNADHPNNPYHANPGKTILQNWGTGLMYEKPGTNQLNNTAKAYKDQFTSSSTRDSVAPQITRITNTKVNNWPHFAIEVSEAQPSAAYEYWYCFGKALGVCDLRPWSSKISKNNALTLPTFGVNFQGPIYATVKVTDSTGNTSQTVSGLKDSLVYPLPPSPSPTPTQMPTSASPTPSKSPSPTSVACPNVPDKAGKVITIRAKGTTGDSVWPKLELRIKNVQGVYELKKTFDLTNPLGNYRSFTYRVPAGSELVKPSQVRLAFINDGVGRDVYVDWIKIGTVRYQTEHCSTYSTGSWASGVGCSGRYAQSEVLSCNGYFDFAKR